MNSELKDLVARRRRRLPGQIAELERILTGFEKLADRTRAFLEDHPHGCDCPLCLALGSRGHDGFPGMLDFLLTAGTFFWSVETHLRMCWPAAREAVYAHLDAEALIAGRERGGR